MHASKVSRYAIGGFTLASLLGLAACGGLPSSKRERDCMARAMYFESNRSSDEGMLAVGTVVMNRLESGKYPDMICGVVGQKNQFAPGVLSKPMQEGRSRDRAERMAAEVLAGKRHRGVGKAMFFHTAGHNFPYRNMHYQVIAGGNAFYEKRTATAGRRNTTQMEVAQAARAPRPGWGSRPVAPPAPVQIAAVDPPPRPPSMAAPLWVPIADPVLAAAPLPQAPQNIEDLILLNGGG